MYRFKRLFCLNIFAVFKEILKAGKMSSGTFVDRIDPFAKRSLKKKSKKSQGSSRYRNSQDVELQQLPQLKGKTFLKFFIESVVYNLSTTLKNVTFRVVLVYQCQLFFFLLKSTHDMNQYIFENRRLHSSVSNQISLFS